MQVFCITDKITLSQTAYAFDSLHYIRKSTPS